MKDNFASTETGTGTVSIKYTNNVVLLCYCSLQKACVALAILPAIYSSIKLKVSVIDIVVKCAIFRV